MTTKLLSIGAFAALLAVLTIAPAVAQGTAPTTAVQPEFASPEEAANALVDAVRAADPQALLALIGPTSDEWLFTGDDVSDRQEWAKFLGAWNHAHQVVRAGEDAATLVVGEDEWAFPAPIVRQGQRWVFDGAAGRHEVMVRRVGRNELDTIQTLLAIVDAQREYAAGDLDGDGFNDYASRWRSEPGLRNGLYWPVQPGEPLSPLGPLVGMAAEEGYRAREAGEEPRPYHGYFYRLLTEQGPGAQGGAYGYVADGRLIGGFAVLAYPARYGVSGIMTLMVNHSGVVYQKDLGDDTAALATAIASFDPDASWAEAE